MMNILEKMQEMTMELNAEELLEKANNTTVEETEIPKKVEEYREVKKALNERRTLAQKMIEKDRNILHIVYAISEGNEVDFVKEDEIFYSEKEFNEYLNKYKESDLVFHVVHQKAGMISNEENEQKETTGDIKDTYRGFEITCYKDSYSEAKNNYHYIRKGGKKTVEEMKVVIDEVIEERTRDYINRFGRYENNKDIFLGLVVAFESEKEFLDFYEDIAKEESYVVKIEFTQDEYEDYADEMDEEEFNDELDADLDYLDSTLKGYLEDFECDEIDENRLEISCYGDKELKELEKLLDDECDRFEFINIYTTYGPEGNWYDPVKNKDL